MKTKHLICSLAACALFGLTACQAIDVPSRTEEPGQLVDAKDEQQLIATATEIDRRIAAREELNGQRSVDDYLQAMTDRLLTATQAAPGVIITARALKTAAPEAFALANGSLYVSQGVIGRLDNPSQLAAIVGREVLHYVHRDQLRTQRARSSYLLSNLLPNLLLITATAGLAGPAVERSVNNALNGYSEQLEQQTDLDVITLLARAGYQPDQAPLAYRALQLTSPQRGQSFGTKLTSELRLQERIRRLDAALTQTTPPATLAEDPAGIAPWDQVLSNTQRRVIDDAFVNREYPLATLMVDRLEPTVPPSGRLPYLRALIAQRMALGYEGDERALTYFITATGFTDCPVEAYRELGLIYRRRAEQAKAAEAFRTYLAKRPNASDAVFIRSYLEQAP